MGLIDQAYGGSTFALVACRGFDVLSGFFVFASIGEKAPIYQALQLVLVGYDVTPCASEGYPGNHRHPIAGLHPAQYL